MKKHIRKLTILIVQQDDYERGRMVDLLEKGSIGVLQARDGKEALHLLEQEMPDILIADIALEKIGGLELVAMARSMSPQLKIIVAHGPYSPGELVKVVEYDVAGFVPLPVDGGKLRGVVMRCAQAVAFARRFAQADYSLRQLLDFFPAPAVLVDGLRTSYMNRRLADFLGYEDYDAMGIVDMGLEDFITQINDEAYDGHPDKWIRDIVDDPLDRDHIVYVENPRHPEARSNAFAVTFNQFPGSELRLFTFQDVSGFEDERAHLEDEASTDPLTQALNRRSFLRLLGQAAASDHSFSLVMFDIDHFKAINDTYGHDVGDAVLKEISALVRENIRGKDTLARWGGEEFMVLSVQSDMAHGLGVAERLREAVAQHSFTGVSRQITSSFGVAVHDPGESADELTKRVDLALYQAKESGRNRVVKG